MDISELGNELIDAGIDGSVFGHLHSLPGEDLAELLEWMGGEAKSGNAKVMPVASRAVEVTLLKARDGQGSGLKCQEALKKVLSGFEEGVDEYSETQLREWLEIALLTVLSTHHNDGARHSLDKPCLGDFTESFQSSISELYFDVVLAAISSGSLSSAICETICNHLTCIGVTRRNLQPKVTKTVLSLVEVSTDADYCPQALRISTTLNRFYNILKAAFNTTSCPQSTKSEIQQAFEAAKSHPHASISVQLIIQRKEKEVPRFDLRIPEKGLLTRSEVNSIILEGLKALEPWETIGQQHLQGLEQNQIDAARKLQLVELEAFKKAAAQTAATAEEDGDVPVTKLLHHAERKEQALHAGRDALRNMKDETLHAAFTALADSCRFVSQEGVGPAYHSIALLTRFSAQITQSDSGISSSLSDIVLEEVCRPKQTFSLTLNSALQYLYSYYATLAPFQLKDDPILLQPDFDSRDESFTSPTKTKSDKKFTFSECDTNSAYVTAFNKLLKGLGPTLLLEPQDEKDYHGREATTFLSELLVTCPAIPTDIWNSVEAEFCKSGDELLIWAGVNGIAAVLLNRPACADRSLKQLLVYCTAPADELLRSISINILIHDILPNHPTIFDKTISYIKKQIIDLLQSSDPSSTAGLQGAVTLFLSLCCSDMSLLDYLFDLVDEHMKRLAADKKRDDKEINEGLATIFRHEYLTKLLLKMGVDEAMRLVKERPASVLSLHVLQTMIKELRNELQNSKDISQEEVDLISDELLTVQNVAKMMYESDGDIRYLIAQLSLTPKDEIVSRILPGVIKKCRPEHVRYAIHEAITPLPMHYSKGIGLNPGAVLLYLHQLVPGENDIVIKHIVIALDCCLLDLKHLFTDQEVAQSLQQLITLDPIPIVFMRTVLQAVHSHPNLLSYILSSIVPHLYQKLIWDLEDKVCCCFFYSSFFFFFFFYCEIKKKSDHINKT